MFDYRELKIVALLVSMVGLLGIGGCLVGCASLNSSPPVEAFANKISDQVGVALSKGIEQGVRSYTVQANAQGINPTYVVNVEGKWVVGVEARATIGVEGVAGSVHVTTQGDDETEPSPASLGGAVPPGTQPLDQP